MGENYTIGELAREFGVTARTIRHYEDEGLLAPLRDGTRRVYRQRDRVRLALILRGRRLGFSLAEAREIIDLYTAPQGEIGQLHLLLDGLADKRAALEQKRRDIDVAVANMDRFAAKCRERLAALEAAGTADRAAQQGAAPHAAQ